MLQDEYYVIESENNDNYPLFSWDQFENEYGLGKPVEYQEPVKFRLGDPLSPNFEWVDYHVAPEPIISKKIVDALLPLDLYGVQFVPAKVRNPKDPFSEVKDYWFMHVWNQIACLDKEKSDFTMSKSGRTIFGIDKLVLNEKTLSLFELRKRQIFELTEDTSVLLIHQSIKDAIDSVKPKGCRFFKATDWYSDIVFEK